MVKFGVIAGEITSEAGEPSLGTRLSAGVGMAGNQRAWDAGREPEPGRPGRHFIFNAF